MVIFHSYVSLPDGSIQTHVDLGIHHWKPPLWCFFCQVRQTLLSPRGGVVGKYEKNVEKIEK